MRGVDHLVIGGGPAGSMVAMRLAEAGREVLLLEKERTAHDKVCGEFLSREAVQYLSQCGVALSDLGAAVISSVRLSAGRRVVEAALPFPARSLSRRVLDAAMLSSAEEKGCEVRRGAYVETLESDGDNWLAKIRNGQTVSARSVFLANGKHDLHGWNRVSRVQGDLIGFKLHWKLDRAMTEALRGFMELLLFHGGYGGLSLVEDDVANLCLVVQRSELRREGGWAQLLAAILNENRHVRRYLQTATALWDRPLAICPIPYGYLAGRPGGLWCVGDQAAVIPSFTGDGMSIALHSGALAAQMCLAGNSVEEYNHKLQAQLSRGMSLATLLSRAMVSGFGRNLASFGLLLFPNAMQWIATSTRIPERALLKGAAGAI
jgi:flavin-dependent dehydrogenase